MVCRIWSKYDIVRWCSEVQNMIFSANRVFSRCISCKYVSKYMSQRDVWSNSIMRKRSTCTWHPEISWYSGIAWFDECNCNRYLLLLTHSHTTLSDVWVWMCPYRKITVFAWMANIVIFALFFSLLQIWSKRPLILSCAHDALASLTTSH